MNGYVKVTYTKGGTKYAYAVPDYIELSEIGDFVVCENAFYTPNSYEPRYKITEVVEVHSTEEEHCNYYLNRLKPIVSVIPQSHIYAYGTIREAQRVEEAKRVAEARKSVKEQEIKDVLIDFMYDFCENKIQDGNISVINDFMAIVKKADGDLSDLKERLAEVM